MRNIKFTSFFIITLLVFNSCGDDSVSVDTISTAPTINITAPGTLVAGSATALTAEVKDGSITPLKEGTITLKSGSTVVSTNKQTATSEKLNLSISADIVKNQLPGSYKLEIVAVDMAGQETKSSKDISIACDALASCKVAGKTTVILVAPPTTPADAKIGLIGSLTGWGSDIVMTKVSTNCYCTAVEFPNGTEFKFRRSENASTNPDWPYVEKDAECKEVDNRKQGGAPDKTIVLSVLNWRNTGTCPD